MFDKLISIVIVISFIILINIFILDFYMVSSSSMRPFLFKGDQILVNKFSYSIFGFRYSEIKIGDLVVFEHNREKYIKRVVGVKGQLIQFNQDNVFVDGRSTRSNEYDHVDSLRIGSLRSIKIKDEVLFLLGDNFHNSIDSREIGLINENQVLGEALLVIFNQDKTERIGLIIE